MKNYEIKEFKKNGKISVMVFSKTYISSLKFIKEIEKELFKKYNSEIDVYFDFLLTDIDNCERFGKAIFDGTEFVKESFSIVEVPKNDIIVEFANFYYLENLDNLNFKVLSSNNVRNLFGL